MVEYTRVNGEMMLVTDLDTNDTLQETITGATLKEVRLMGREVTSGLVERPMRVSGRMD